MPRRTNPAPEPHRFFNRDESWLRFNWRVLEEAQDERNPLLERVKFLAITASNLDEFVEIRVAGVLQRLEDGYVTPQAEADDGMSEQQRLEELNRLMHAFVCDQYRCWNDQLLPALLNVGVRVLEWSELDDAAREYAEQYYNDEVDPLLTPVTIDPAHPFPRVLNKALCIALLLRRKRKGAAAAAPILGVITVPRSLPRFVKLPCTSGCTEFIFLHDLIEAQAERLFRGYEVLAKTAFRVTRNSNLYLQEEETRSLLESVRSELHNRRKGDAVRLEVSEGADPEIVERLRANFELDTWQVFKTEGPVNLSRLMNLYSGVDKDTLKYPPFHGREYRLDRKSIDLWDELRTRDIMLHHPFDSYSVVEEFIEAAAADPAVVSMKQTLYRTSADSPMFAALVDAAQQKDVTVVVELMARFDEASNIRWARTLEDAGVQVFHGIFGLKTHCKLALMIRRDPDGVMRRYAHLGTGNYNPITARFYTDISLLTANPEITHAVHAVFNYLTAEAEGELYRPLMMAPLTLVDDLEKLIDREIEHAKAGKPAHLIAKMNGLIDRRLIEAMYRASQAGVEIDLIIRGMCALRPGVPGISDHIRVRSIVGRFLEHSRIFWFLNDGADEAYCGSADWMPRNLYDRCEAVFPIYDQQLLVRLREDILGSYLRDEAKARLLTPDGHYVRPARVDKPFDAQAYLMQQTEGVAPQGVAPQGVAPQIAQAGVTKPQPATKTRRTKKN
ncbi:polyphosphate kinase 1 [Terriglobus albidus]|uniref:Polyphosphate kinase n=1 Tax=Terriglobus albidus TaxID=1592106 RepID=A0A5B9EAS4_9BACT|nr:polyphosphate kinase 1 [Terriglobus albidus]QEE29263.1 polyphosphate kinase 1 [Terriglobus albidus]